MVINLKIVNICNFCACKDVCKYREDATKLYEKTLDISEVETFKNIGIYIEVNCIHFKQETDKFEDIAEILH